MAQSRCWTHTNHWAGQDGHSWSGGGYGRKRKWQDRGYPDEGQVGNVQRQGDANDHYAYAPNIIGFVCEDKQKWFPRGYTQEMVYTYWPDTHRNEDWGSEFQPRPNKETWMPLTDPEWKSSHENDYAEWYCFELKDNPCKILFGGYHRCAQMKSQKYRRLVKTFSMEDAKRPYEHFMKHLINSGNHNDVNQGYARMLLKQLPLKVTCYTWAARQRMLEFQESQSAANRMMNLARQSNAQYPLPKELQKGEFLEKLMELMGYQPELDADLTIFDLAASNGKSCQPFKKVISPVQHKEMIQTLMGLQAKWIDEAFHTLEGLCGTHAQKERLLGESEHVYRSYVETFQVAGDTLKIAQRQI